MCPAMTPSQAIAQWRQRMAGEEAREIYKQRCANVECANAQLCRFNLCGLVKAKAVPLWHALAAHDRARSGAANLSGIGRALAVRGSGRVALDS
jgi:hypothetical protein